MRNYLLVYLVLLGAFINTQVFGQKTVVESFDYATGNIEGKGTATDGWGGAWTKTAGQIDVVDGNLGSDVVGKSLKTVSGSGDWIAYFRELKEKWVDDGNPVWISFYMKRDDTTPLKWGGLSLYNGENEDLFIGCPWEIPTVGFNNLPTTTPNTNLNFITVKLEMNGTAAKDKAYMWVNYTGNTEPDVSTAEISQEWGTDGFTKIRIGNDPLYSISYDQIRIASTFQASSNLEFTTTGSCASYITYNNSKSHQADSVYTVEKTKSAIVIDGVAESAWANAVPVVIKKIAHEKKAGEVLNLSDYPQSETDLYTTYKALWTDNGMYMFIDVKDDMVRYQNPEYQWENDGIEFYFAKAVGEGKIQVIIPAMVGTTNPSKPAAKDFESGSATGSDPAYKVFGFDANNWDASTFKWAIKKTATGYTMEVYMDKDIVTNGNSETNFGKDKMFAGDVNVDEADEKQNTNTPALYVREGTLAMLGNSNQEYASSNYYGWFKLVDNTTSGELEFTTTGSCASYITWNNATSHQADSVYTVEKTKSAIVIDGVAESAWANAVTAVIKKIAHEKKAGEVLDLSNYPQSETDLYTTYKALWTDNGMYMFIDVKDDMVRYQNPEYQWENDGIEFYFAKAVGEGKIQVIIPAMVGTTNPKYPAAKDFEYGTATGSDPAYKVFGFDANNWDESTFKWAIKKNATGYTMEVYMDKDIVTNGNSETNFGKDKMFAGDVNVDEADEKQNTNTPALYVREGTLAMLGNSNQEYASSNYYGWFKLVDNTTSGELEFTTTGSCADYITWNNATSHQADSIYSIEKTAAAITVDGVAETAWTEAKSAVIKKIAHEKKPGEVLNLSDYPQSETDLYSTYKALWTDNGVYMLIEVEDDMVRYQNPEYQWENDGIEFYFAKAVGEGKIQVIIPAMVGTTNPAYPVAKDFESGSATGSNPAYKVFGFDANNWDESTFKWAIKKTATGYTMEAYMDKDIVTNGNSDTNFGLNKMFAGDVNIDEADEKQNTNTPALYVREGTLAMLGNSNQEYASSNYYGWFKMVNEITTGISTNATSDFDVMYSSANKEITIRANNVVSATLYNTLGQTMTTRLVNGKISVANLKNGIYIISADDANGNRVGSKRIAIF